MRLAYSVFLFFHRISLLYLGKERKKGMNVKQEMICFHFAMFLFSSIIEGREGLNLKRGYSLRLVFTKNPITHGNRINI